MFYFKEERDNIAKAESVISEQETISSAFVNASLCEMRGRTVDN